MADFRHEWELLAMAVASVTLRDPEKRKLFPQKVHDEVLAMAGEEAAIAFRDSFVRVVVSTAGAVVAANPEMKKWIEENK